MQVYHQHYTPPKVLDEYNLKSKHFDSKGFAYLEIRKGIYGLKEAAILAYDQLKDHLANYGYIPFKHTPGMWHHTTWPLTFTLAVDDFGISEISNQQSNPTEKTAKACKQLMDCLFTHPKAVIQYYACDMILSLISDAAYLVLPDATSCCATLYTLSDAHSSKPPSIKPNGPVHVLVKTIRGVHASASEAEMGNIFIGA